jgi:hypothetical protein
MCPENTRKITAVLHEVLLLVCVGLSIYLFIYFLFYLFSLFVFIIYLFFYLWAVGLQKHTLSLSLSHTHTHTHTHTDCVTSQAIPTHTLQYVFVLLTVSSTLTDTETCEVGSELCAVSRENPTESFVTQYQLLIFYLKYTHLIASSLLGEMYTPECRSYE